MFEITNKKDQKVITILGVKFHYKRPEKMYIFEHIFCYFIRKFCKIKKNKIVFVTSTSWQYADNPKYIAEELLKREEANNLELVWIYVNQTEKELIPNSFKLVKYTSIKGLFELLTSKVWITNSHLMFPLKNGVVKNKETLYFQTWHGSMGIKKMDADAKMSMKILDGTNGKKCQQKVLTIFL